MNIQKMKLLLLKVTMLFLMMCNINCSLRNDWKQFKEDYNKIFNETEDRKRFRYFKMNLKEIRKHNRKYEKNLETFQMGINEFADLNSKEFQNRYGLYETSSTIVYGNFSEKNNNISDEINFFDWAEKGAVTPAKDQGHCGSCWIYSAVGVLESYRFRKLGKLVPLSEQNIVDCFIADACKGGWPANAFAFIKEQGINSGADYPFHGKQQKCSPVQTKLFNVTYEKLVHGDGSEEDMKNVLIRHGPLAICMYVTTKWRFYKNGVWYNTKCSEDANHSMMLIGYGTENGHDYWLLKNSWGQTWGENGFIKVMRNRHENYCGITNDYLYLI